MFGHNTQSPIRGLFHRRGPISSHTHGIRERVGMAVVDVLAVIQGHEFLSGLRMFGEDVCLVFERYAY